MDDKTYLLCKKVIENGRYVKETMLSNLDLFLLHSRIDQAQYSELVALVEQKEA